MGEVPGIAAVLSNLNADAVKQRERAALKDLKAHPDCQASCSLDKATADGLNSNQYPYVSWPSLIKILVQNIKMYLNGQKNKPKPPNENYARILEKAVKIASGGYFYLWDCWPELYQHLGEVIVGFPTFSEIYAGILARLLNTSEYRFEMDGKLYSEVLDFLLKDKASNNNVLFFIIKRPPVHLDNSLTPRLALRLSAIFAAMSERAHVKKWLGPVLGLLWHDGPNFGDHLLEFHPNASKVLIRHFPMLQGTDKDNPILYFRMQLKLRAVRDTSLTELFEFVDNELLRSTGDTPFLQLASHTIFEALKQGSSYSVNDSKRMKRMHVSEIVMERMSDPGCLSWTGAVCLLIKQYYSELPSDFLSGLLHSLVERLSFAVNEVLGWTIRCVNELCDAAVHHDKSLTGVNEWQRAWNTVVRIVSMRTAPSHVDDAFRLLGCLAAKELVPASVIPQSFWDLDYFKGAPSKSALFFVACYFSSTPSQCFELRKQLLNWSTAALVGQAAQICIHSNLLSAVFLALSTGLKFTDEPRLLPSWSDKEAELAGIDMSEDVIVGCGSFEQNLTSERSQRPCTMEMAQVIELLGILAESLTLSAQELLSVPSLELLFGLCVLVSECVAGCPENAWKSAYLDPLGNEQGFNGRLHRSFTFLKDGHTDMFQEYVKKMRQEGVSHENVHPELIKPLMVDCLSTAWSFRWPAIPSDIEIQNILAIWKDMTKRTRGNNDLLEPLGSCMKVLLRVIERDDCLPLHQAGYSPSAEPHGELQALTSAETEQAWEAEEEAEQDLLVPYDEWLAEVDPTTFYDLWLEAAAVEATDCVYFLDTNVVSKYLTTMRGMGTMYEGELQRLRDFVDTCIFRGAAFLTPTVGLELSRTHNRRKYEHLEKTFNIRDEQLLQRFLHEYREASRRWGACLPQNVEEDFNIYVESVVLAQRDGFTRVLLGGTQPCMLTCDVAFHRWFDANVPVIRLIEEHLGVPHVKVVRVYEDMDLECELSEGIQAFARQDRSWEVTPGLPRL